MDNVEKAINLHGTYTKRLATGILSARDETALLGSISLSDGVITVPSATGDFVERVDARFTEILRDLEEKYGAERASSTPLHEIIKEFPDVESYVGHLETWRHEIIHGVQRHAYRSVFALSNIIQGLEIWEMHLLFSQLSQGETWRLGEEYISALRNMDPRMKERVAGFIARDCRAFIAATNERSHGIGLMHLIEGQAFIGSRLISRPIEDNLDRIPAIYTRAWKAFQVNGGEEGIVFLALVSSALRFGDINKDPDDEDDDFTPHPADIFNYLIEFASEFEAVADGIFETLEKREGQVNFRRRSLNHQNALDALFARVANQDVMPADSRSSILSYTRNKKTSKDRRERTDIIKRNGPISRFDVENGRGHCDRCNADGGFALHDPYCHDCGGTGFGLPIADAPKSFSRFATPSSPFASAPKLFAAMPTDVEDMGDDDGDEYESDEERADRIAGFRANIEKAFAPLSDKKIVEASSRGVGNAVMLELTIVVARVLERAYVRLSKSMAGEFPTEKDDKIANAVANDYCKVFPYYYHEQTIIQAIVGDIFSKEGLFGYFTNQMEERVRVKPISSLPEMSHGEYLALRRMPETIKRLLAIYCWRNPCTSEAAPVTAQPPLPFCCDEHGILPLARSTPQFLDSCPNEGSTGSLFRNILKCTIQSTIQFKEQKK